MDELTTLLGAARDGDGEALASFVRLTQPEVWRFCLHVVGPEHADDATQETFLAAWRAAPSFRGDASARTWLFVIARRCCERITRRHRRLASLDRHVPAPAPTAPPELAAEPAQLLALLEPQRRVAMVLTQLLGLSYAEAAEICECPVGTIRSRVAHAREQLVALRDAAEGTGGGGTGAGGRLP